MSITSLTDFLLRPGGEEIFAWLRHYPPNRTIAIFEEALQAEAETVSRESMENDRAFLVGLFANHDLFPQNREQIAKAWAWYRLTLERDSLLIWLYIGDVRFEPFFEISGQEHFAAAIEHAHPRAPLIVTPHFGPFLAAPIFIAGQGYSVGTFVYEADAPNLRQALTSARPDLSPYIHPIPMPMPLVARRVIEDLKHGRIVTIYPEFSLGGPTDNTAMLLGNTVCAPFGSAYCAKKAEVPLLPMSLRVATDKGWRIQVEFGPPIFPENNENPKETARRLFEDWLDPLVRRFPEAWWGWQIYEDILVGAKNER